MRLNSSDRSRGLTLIEVLVAISVLSIISTVIISSFAATARLNRDASVDVDYSRVVRSAMERTAVFFSDPEKWTDSTVATEEALDTYVTSLSPECSAEIVPPADSDFDAVVVVVRITCGGVDGGLAPQVFEQEFPQP